MAGMVEFLIKAKDEASAVISQVANKLDSLAKKQATSGAPGGQAIGAIAGALSGSFGAAVTAVNQGIELLTKTVDALRTAMDAMGGALAERVNQFDLIRESVGATYGQVAVASRAFARLGLDSEQAKTSLQFMAKAIGNNDPALKAMGINTRDAYTALMMFADKASKTSDEASKQALAIRLLGRGNKDLIGAFPRLNEEMERVRSNMEKWGGSTEGFRGRFRILHRSLNDVGDSWKALNTQFAKSTVDIGISITAVLLKMMDAGREIGKIAKILHLDEVAQALMVAAAFAWDVVVGTLKFIALMLETIMKGVDWTIQRMATVLGKFAPKGFADFVKNYVALIKQANEADPNPEGADTRSRKPLSLGGDERDAKMKKHDELVKQLMTDYKLLKEQAEAWATAIEDAKDKDLQWKQSQQLLDKGMEPPAPFGGGAGSFYTKQGKRVQRENVTLTFVPPSAPGDGSSRAALKDQQDFGFAGAATRIADHVPKLKTAFDEVKAKYAQMVDDMTNTTAKWEDVFGGLWSGLSSGFETVFSNLGNKAQTWKSAMKTVFDSIVSEAYKMVAKLIALKVFKLILNSIAPGSGTFVDLMEPVTQMGGAIKAGGSASAVNITINSMDRSSIVRSLESPRGELRTALRTSGLAGAY